MIKKFLTVLLFVLITNPVFSAGSSGGSSSGGDAIPVSQYQIGEKMINKAKKLGMKVASEIFADRNYEDDGNLVSRKKSTALITDPTEAQEHVLKMVKNQALNCLSGKQIPCEIDSVCIHGDNLSSLETAFKVRENLKRNNLDLKPLDELKKFK